MNKPILMKLYAVVVYNPENAFEGE